MKTKEDMRGRPWVVVVVVLVLVAVVPCVLCVGFGRRRRRRRRCRSRSRRIIDPCDHPCECMEGGEEMRAFDEGGVGVQEVEQGRRVGRPVNVLRQSGGKGCGCRSGC